MGQGLLRTVSTRAWACVAALAVLAGLVAAPAGAASRSGLPLALTVSTPQTTFGANALVSPMVFTVRAPVGGTDRVLMNIPTNQGWPAPFTSPSTARGYVTVQKGGCSYVAIQKLIKNLDGTWSVRVYTTCQAGKTFSITYRAGRAPTLAGASSFGFSRMSSGHQGLVPMTVTPGPVAKLAVSGPATATAGEDTAFSVTPQDQWGNTNPTYAAMVNLSGDDVATVLTGAGAWSGSGTYGANFQNPGARSVTATDAANSSITGTWNTTVSGLVLPDFSGEYPNPMDSRIQVMLVDPISDLAATNPPVTITGVTQAPTGGYQLGLLSVDPDGKTISWNLAPPAGTPATAPGTSAVANCAIQACVLDGAPVFATYTAVDDEGNEGTGKLTLFLMNAGPIILDAAALPSNIIWGPGSSGIEVKDPAPASTGSFVLPSGSPANFTISGNAADPSTVTITYDTADGGSFTGTAKATSGISGNLTEAQQTGGVDVKLTVGGTLTTNLNGVQVINASPTIALRSQRAGCRADGYDVGQARYSGSCAKLQYLTLLNISIWALPSL